MSLVDIESLDLEARGVTHVEGKVTFVRGALTGERVRIAVVKRRPKHDLADTLDIVRPSAARVIARCPHFGVCGGCSMQHLDAAAQTAIKQRALEDALWHLARLRPAELLPAIHGLPWRYRHRARLSVRMVAKKGGALVGFHERGSSYVADMDSCEILPQPISQLLVPLRRLVERLTIAQRLPQIEVSVGDRSTVLVMRVLEPPSGADLEALRAFARTHAVQIHLQPKGPDTVHPLESDAETLEYSLPEFDVRIGFLPTDFTQVNHAINRVLVRRALALLAPAAGERVVDLFCGLGNFTLPIARTGAHVVGVEGNSGLVQRARANAAANGLAERAEFCAADLFRNAEQTLQQVGPCDRMLIDPPREGALEVVKALGAAPPRRIVYVSCNPATLARDAGLLVHQHGYTLACAGVINMFPQTSHVESIARFERA